MGKVVREKQAGDGDESTAVDLRVMWWSNDGRCSPAYADAVKASSMDFTSQHHR